MTIGNSGNVVVEAAGTFLVKSIPCDIDQIVIGCKEIIQFVGNLILIRCKIDGNVLVGCGQKINIQCMIQGDPVACGGMLVAIDIEMGIGWLCVYMIQS